MKGFKDRYIVYVIAGGVILLTIGATLILVSQMLQPKTRVQLGDGVFDAKVATTEAERQKGLGGVTSLGESEALLMVYGADSAWPIWMKDMKIPIDIVWLDKNKKVVDIVRDVSPDEGTDVTHIPRAKARYVIELAAGTVTKKTIREGMQATFELPNQEVKE
jgi:uncharacterized membrane protein (UPF0127 family)